MRRSLVLLVALALSGATAAEAAKGDTWIGLRFGPSLPARDLTQSARNGFQGGLSLTRMESRRVGVGVDAAYHAWGGSDDANRQVAALFGPGSSVRFHAIQATLHVLYDFLPGGKARPYAEGGAGLYSVRTNLYTRFGAFGGREWNFGYSMGAGVILGDHPSYAIGLGGTYHVIETSGFQVGVVTVGVNLMWRVGAGSGPRG